jgi:hypothetical protein
MYFLPRSITTSIASSVLLSAMFFGCSSSTGPSLDPQKSNCETACGKLHDCISDSTNTDKCTSDCSSQSDKDDVYKAKVTSCSDCLANNNDCTSAAKTCSDDCLKIVLP